MKIPKDQHEVIANAVRKGDIYREIAERYGVSAERIRQIANKENVFIRGFVARKARQVIALIEELNEESKKLFFHSGFNLVDLTTECLNLYKTKRFTVLRRGDLFDVKFHEIIWNTHCPITGGEIDYFTDRMDNPCSAIELINPNGGYVNGNVQTVLRFRKSS